MSLRRVVFGSVLALFCACGLLGSEPEDGGTDAGADASTYTCTGETPICCQDDCTNDLAENPVCGPSGWECPTVRYVVCPASQCRGYAPPSSLKPCADADAGVCLNACDPGEVCFTQVSCGPVPDGGSSCTLGQNAAADNRCHRLCGAYGCAGSELCQQATFFGCADYNAPRSICCSDAGC